MTCDTTRINTMSGLFETMAGHAQDSDWWFVWSPYSRMDTISHIVKENGKGDHVFVAICKSMANMFESSPSQLGESLYEALVKEVTGAPPKRSGVSMPDILHSLRWAFWDHPCYVVWDKDSVFEAILLLSAPYIDTTDKDRYINMCYLISRVFNHNPPEVGERAYKTALKAVMRVTM